MSRLHRLRRTLGFLTAATGGLLALIVAIGFALPQRTLDARVMRDDSSSLPWLRISPQQILSGATLPSSSNVMFQLPATGFTEITREALLGGKGEDIRYWGYCLPENYDPKLTSRTAGLPGKLFLSEKERKFQQEKLKQLTPTPSIYAPNVNFDQPTSPLLRHQIEIFKPMMICYIMTETPLAIGLDPDDDLLNSKLERDVGTDANNPDTDGDGLLDGVEYLRETDPLQRDSDQDGLIDGLEDKDQDGRMDAGETDPRNRDTDRDGLCDGLCEVALPTGEYLYMGEDVDLSGTKDAGEADPLLAATQAGLNDFDAFLLCRQGTTRYCFP